MNYAIYDQKGNKLAPLQNRTSVQWKPRYYESGTCEIHARPTDENVKYLKKWNRVICIERNEIMFISSVSRTDDEIIIKGHMDNLDTMINRYTVTIKNVEDGLREVLMRNGIRGLNVVTGVPKGFTHTIKGGMQTTYGTIRETYEKVCKEFNLGWHEIVKGTSLNYLELYEGEIKQRARFSDAIGNVINQSYEEDMSKYKNVVCVAGEEKEDGTRTIVEVNMKQEGEPYLELYVDARDIQSEYKDENGNDKTYTKEEYESLLRERGKAKLEETRKDAFIYNFELNQDNAISVLGKDYDLGDVVPVLSTKYNLQVYARITGIDFIEEGNEDTKIKLEVKLEEMKGVSL